MPTLPDYLEVSLIRHRSPALPYGSPYLPDKIIFRAFFVPYCLRFSPFLAQKNFLFVVRFLGHFCTYLVTDKDNFWLANILTVCTSCKTSYNVLSHSHWGLGQFVGGWGRGPLKFRREWKKESLQFLDLQRLASLPFCVALTSSKWGKMSVHSRPQVYQ